MQNCWALLEPFRVLIYSGRVPSGPFRVALGPRLDWSDPTPHLGLERYKGGPYRISKNYADFRG